MVALLWRAVRRLSTSSSSRGGLARVRTAGTTTALTPVQLSREAERRRFGLPVWQLLSAGLVGCIFLARWYGKIASEREAEWSPVTGGDEPLSPFILIESQEQVVALLSDVRVVLAKHGISLGSLPLRVELGSLPRDFEGTTRKALRPPPVLRGIEAITLRPGLTAIQASQVLAHEYTHAWLWLQKFPPLDPRLEEGLCELFSYLYLLSCLRDPEPRANLARDERALEAQIRAIEGNDHPDYGHGFRECVQALRGRSLHALLAHVRMHGALPPQQPDEAEASEWNPPRIPRVIP